METEPVQKTKICLETKLIAEKMYEEIIFSKKPISALTIAEKSQEHIELFKKNKIENPYSVLRTSKKCPLPLTSRTYNLVLGNPSLHIKTYTNLIIKMFSLVEDKGQLITTCLTSWIDGDSLGERTLRLMVEEHGYHLEVPGNKDLIILVLTKRN